ncbi:benzoate 4-monooxygenase cytochrome P450 [Aspergillus keveii]|uniref:Benzoate 4-monooxygenase cytochrome P450 n=1 Tax=Aspergillus keveii TaxID=714993 RepID=A0ABR4FKS0_9EURO
MDNILHWNPQWAALISGVVVHHGLFRRGEWHCSANSIILTYSTVFASALLLASLTSDLFVGTHPLTPPLVTKLHLCHFAGLFSSVLVYRAFFHRLRRFPGPRLARLGSLYAVVLAHDLGIFRRYRKVHQQYGDLVRVGPSELSIADPEAVKVIHPLHGQHATPKKGPWYDQPYPRFSLQTTRDDQEHARLRRIWDKAFNTKALREYSPRVRQHAIRLHEVIEQSINNSQPLDVTQWFNYYSFDVMGDLAFGKSFNMLAGGGDHYFVSMIHENMRYVGHLGPLVWLFPLFSRIPVLNWEILRFWRFVAGQIAERRKNPPSSPDVFHWILEGYGDSINTPKGMLALEAEAELVIVAGSDTTAATLTNTTFELIRNPGQVTKLRAELNSLNKDIADVTPEDLVKLPHLNAIINETLRLYPPVPSGVQRKTVPEGLRIGETLIPPETIVQVPFYTLLRDERYFAHPEEFIPERWTSRPDLIHDSSVFIPFSAGAYSCVGKQLALMELRWVLTTVVSQFDMEFLPGFDQQAFIDGSEDTFTLVCEPLPVRFSKRKV